MRCTVPGSTEATPAGCLGGGYVDVAIQGLTRSDRGKGAFAGGVDFVVLKAPHPAPHSESESVPGSVSDGSGGHIPIASLIGMP